MKKRLVKNKNKILSMSFTNGKSHLYRANCKLNSILKINHSKSKLEKFQCTKSKSHLPHHLNHIGQWFIERERIIVV